MPASTDSPHLGSRFREALGFAFDLHRKQVRKGTGIPYVSHLLAVAALVLEHGGGEDEAIAALLHDAVEDQGGATTLAAIRTHFGDGVADLVAELSDSIAEADEEAAPKPPWRERKEAYLAHLATASPAARLVSAADKLHNLRAILSDLRVHGDALWKRFNAGPQDQLWYYQQLHETLVEGRATRLAQALGDEVHALAAAVRAPARTAVRDDA